MSKISNFKFQINNFLRHPLFSGSAVMVGGSMAVNVINYVYHLVFGRILGPENYGVLASIYSLLYIVTIIPTSASVSIVKFVSSAKTKDFKAVSYHGINRLMLWVGGFSLVLIIAASPLIANFLHIEQLSNIVMVAPIVFFTLLSLVNQSTSQALLKFSGYVAPNIASSASKFVLGMLFIYFGWKVEGAVAAILISVILAYLISRPYVIEIVRTRPRHVFQLKQFIKYSAPVLVQALAFTSFFTTDVLLVKHFFSSFDAGLYAALSTLGKIIFFAVTPIASTMFPIVSGRKSRGEKFAKIFYMSCLITVLISFGTTSVYWLFPKLVIGILYGSEYLSISANLVWIGAFITFYTVSYLLVNFSLSVGETKSVVFPFLGAIFQVVGIWFFHDSLLTVIKISFYSALILCFVLIVFLRYNRLFPSYDKI